jgi:hypothetical protein
MHHHHSLLAAVILTIISSEASAQGCSDAGVCTAGPIGEIPTVTDSTTTEEEPRHFARLTFSYAVGEQAVVIAQVQPELSLGITERLSVQVKVPYISASGNLGKNSGVGDVVSTISFAFIKERERNLTGIAGMRLPTGRFTPESFAQATFGPNAQPLPMPYQLGLGTTDLLLGVQYRHKRWSGTLAYQHVLVQDNQSTFLHRYWSGVPEALGYFESYALERANDAVARIQYGIPVKRLTLQPGVLAIWHVGMDSRLAIPNVSAWSNDTTPFRSDIVGSEGLTLNLTADARYRLNDAWAIEASFGSPLVVREVRPDGLTRALVANMGLRFAF